MENLLLQFIDPEIAALTIAYTAGVLRGISKFYPYNLGSTAKMAISCVIGVFLAFVELPEAITLETAINAILKGGISGFTATTGYSAVKNINKTKETSTDLNLPI